MSIAVVGAGIAGLSCAEAISALGHEVILFDKGRGPGGRMSTRRIASPMGEVSFNHGAQYFTARDPAFQQQVDRWAGQGTVARWPEAAHDAWVGTPGMNAVIKAMAAGQDVRWNVHVDRLERDGNGWTITAGAATFSGFSAVVLAVPSEQALPFLSLHDFAMARQAMPLRSLPCWTGMFAFAQPLSTQQGIIRDTGAIAWAARGFGSGDTDSGPQTWVVQARPEWSDAHLELSAEEIAPLLQAELAAALGIDLPEPLIAVAHRWRYAMNPGLRLGALWNGDIGLGACGDWLMGPRVECAWLSGQALAEKIANSVSVPA